MTPAAGLRTPSIVATAHAPTPEVEWAALACLLAARARMRVSRNGGRAYRARDERRVTETLPNQPAAVLLYDHTGCAPVLALDLDVSRGGAAAVERDTANLARLLRRVGARWFSDRSPNGGRHVYVPLARPAPLHEVRQVMAGLCAFAPTLDPLPMLNIDSGCIRPPGARHKSGGHQRLDGTVPSAVETFRHPADDSVWRRLIDEVRPARTEGPLAAPATTDDERSDRLEPLHGYAGPDETFTAIARTGTWDGTRYRSASEARQGVVWSAAASGWSFGDVARRIEDGTWPGLASLYARYSPAARHQALVRDWRNAISFETRRRAAASGSEPVRERTTSKHQTQRGQVGRSVDQQVRVWLAAVDMVAAREDLAVRAVLYAIGEAAVLAGSLDVEHGNRSLAVATGLDQSSVGRALKRIRDWPSDRAVLDLVRPAEGVRAHTYSLVVPALLRPACESKPWRRGRIHAVRPAFRELGMAAAFVYAALEQAREPLDGRTLAPAAGLGHSATYEALLTLASWGLADRTPAGWVLGHASLDRLAEMWGVTEQVNAQVERHRAEREQWWRFLGIIRLPVREPDPWLEPDEPPGQPPGQADAGLPSPRAAAGPTEPEVPDAAVLLLMDRLGAEVIHQEERHPLPGFGNSYR